MPRGRALLLAGLVALVLAGAGAPAPSHAQGVTVEHGGADTLVVAPGERASVAFRVVNHGGRSIDLRLSLEAPEAWRVVASPPHLALPAGGASVRVVSFFAPAKAPAGVYPISLAAEGGGARASDRVLVRVGANPDLHAEVEEAPVWATASEPYSVRFRVTNAGNVPLAFGIRIDSPHDFRARADTTSIRLDPGASAAIPVVVTPPEELGRALVHGLRLWVVAEGDSAEAVARVEVVPQGRTAREERGGLPTEVRLRASADPRAGPPVRVHAAGPLRPGSRTRVEALLQGPTRGYSMFGETDVYRLRLESPRFSLGVGDDVYRLSRLTEPGQEGLGVAATARAGPFEAGGFVQRDRRSFQPDTQYAAFTEVSLGRPLELRANWFRRDSREGRREVVSGEAALRVPGWLSVQGEYGWRPETAAAARTVDLRGNRGPLSVTLRHMRGDSAYGGSYAGLASDGAHLQLRPWRALFLEGSVTDQSIRRSGRMFDFDQSHRSARVAAGWGSAITMEGRHLERISRSSILDTERAASSLRLRLGVPLGALDLYPSVEAGRNIDRLTDESSRFWRTGLRTRLSTGPASVSTSVEYFTGGTLHRSVAEEGISGTASASLRVGSSLRLSASAYGTRYLAPIERSNLIVNGMAEQRLPWGHRVSARVLSRMSTGVFDHRETIALLDYTIPLKLPVGRAAGSASVVGRVFDAETGEPLRRAIVRVGGRRIATDARGRVTVRGLEPGTHYVDIDRSTLGSGRVPTVPMPLRVEVRSGRRTEFELGLVAAGQLGVEVRLVRAGSASGRAAAGEEEALARALLEFRSGEERFRRPTDERGRVELGTVRPGEWSVKVVQADLPPFHRFDEDSVSLRVAPGQRTDLELVARPVERRMQVVASGELREEREGERAGERAEPGRVEPEADDRGSRESERERDRETGAEKSYRVPMTMPLWQVAWLMYRESSLWPKIWVANRDRAPDPAAVPGGVQLRIPPKAPLNAAEQRAREERRRQVSAPRTEPTTFRVPENMPLWDVAWRVYRDTDLWPKIWVANREMIPDPSAARIGLLLEIPPAAPLTPEERRADQEYRQRNVLSLPPDGS